MKNTLFAFAGIVALAIILTNLRPNTKEPLITETPMVYEKHSIEDILNDSSDEELVKISGEIIKRIEDRTYLFRGKTGDIHIRIDEESAPDQGIQFKQPMVINGSVSHEKNQRPQVEADHIRFVF